MRYAPYFLILAGVMILFTTVSAQSPSSRPGCVYNSTLPTLTDKQIVALQCDSSGKLWLH